MAESFIQVPPNSTGARMRTRTKVVGGTTVHESAYYRPGGETWFATADNVANANAKAHFGIFNGTGSGVVIMVRKVFFYNLGTGAVTGAYQRYDFKKSTAQSAGTAVVPLAADTNNAALPGAVLIATGPTVTDGGLITPFLTLTEENAITQPLTTAMFQQTVNLLPEGDSIQEVVLREGQGFVIRQNTASTLGTYAWTVVFTVDTP